MKLIVGYFALIGVLLTGLYVFANQHASAETEVEEVETEIPLQQTSSERDEDEGLIIPSADAYHI